jgi:hypothetical protein
MLLHQTKTPGIFVISNMSMVYKANFASGTLTLANGQCASEII